MVEIAIIGGAIVLTFAVVADSTAAITCVTAIITVRGITWLAKKITQNLNRDCSEIINFAGWSLTGVSVIRLLNLSLIGIKPVTSALGAVGKVIGTLASGINGVVGFFDKIF